MLGACMAALGHVYQIKERHGEAPCSMAAACQLLDRLQSWEEPRPAKAAARGWDTMLTINMERCSPSAPDERAVRSRGGRREGSLRNAFPRRDTTRGIGWISRPLQAGPRSGSLD